VALLVHRDDHTLTPAERRHHTTEVQKNDDSM
jgi:hypothetical protein